MKRKTSLRKGIFIPFISVIMVALLTFVVLWRLEYNRIAEDQSDLYLTRANDNTQTQLLRLLGDPDQAAMTLRDNIEHLDLFNKKETKDLEAYLIQYLKSIHENMPQVSVIFYADDLKNFIGFRVNAPNDFSLMLQDQRTQGLLKIYDGDHMGTEELASYENYDPRIRPFYKPIAENPSLRWSEIYINQDEINDATVSVIYPILDDQGQVIAVMGFDVKLNGIHAFLREEADRIESDIYLVDQDFNLVAFSGVAGLVKPLDDEDAPDSSFMSAFDGPDQIVSKSAKYYADHLDADFYTFDHAGKSYKGLHNQLQAPEDLGWHIISLINEDVVIGDLTRRQNAIIVLVVGVLFIGSLWAFFLLRNVTQPILEVTRKASRVAEGDWEVDLKNVESKLHETDALTQALDHMVITLKDNYQVLAQNEAKYRALVNNLDEMVCILSTEGRVMTTNPRFDDYFELDLERDPSSHHYFNTYFDNDHWSRSFAKLMDQKRKVVFQERIRHIEVEDQILNINMIPVLDAEGAVDFIITSVTDVSTLLLALEREAERTEKENQRLEALITQRTRDLEVTLRELAEHEKLASLGGLVSGVAHEINTPLGVAVTTASYIDKINRENQSLVEDNKLTKKGFIKFMTNIEDSIKILNSNLYRASDLIKSFKKIAVNQSHLSLETFNLEDYIHATMVSLKHELKRQKHEVIVDIPEEFYVKSYPGVYSQVLTNLVMNSIIHGFKGKDHGQIHLKVTKDDKNLILVYRDDGLGMTEEVRSQIFEPFFTTNRGGGGTGLGLSVVYNLITGQLKGNIKCESEPNQGVIFTITIPLVEEW